MASTINVGILRALLTADTAEYDKAMKRAQDAAGAFSKSWAKVGQQAQQLGMSLTKTLTLPIVGIGGASMKAFMDFESAFANVRKTVDGSEPQFKALENTFRQMAKEIPATTEELSAIAALGGQMGVPIDQLANFTRNVAALGVAVDGISTEEAAAGLAQIGNIAGVGTTQIAEMSSTLVHLGNNSNATEGDILEFTKRLMGAGHTVGMTVPEVMALGTAMADVGINAEAGGTAMSQMITKMSMAVSKGGEALEAFGAVSGLGAEKFAQMWKTKPIEAINAVIQGLGNAKASGVDLNLIVGKLGATNVRTADTMKRLAGAGDGVAMSLKTANEGWVAGNKHLEEAEKKYATTANQLKMLWSRIKDVGITLGEALVPAIDFAIRSADRLIPILEEMIAWFKALPGWAQASAVGLLGVAAAAGPVLVVVGQLIQAISALAGAFAAKGIATAALGTSMSGLAVTLGVLAAKAAAVVGVGFGAWHFGKWIGEVSGLTNGVEYLSGKLMGLTDEQIAAGRASRLQAEAHAAQAAAVKDAGKETDIGADIAKAMAEAQKKASEATKGTTGATKELDEWMKKGSKSTKEAEEAAKKLAAQLEKQEAALRSMGVVTQKDVNEALQELADLMGLAETSGVPMVAFLKAAEKQLLALEKKAKDAGLEFGDLRAAIAETRSELDRLLGRQSLDLDKLFKQGAKSADLLVKSVKPITLELTDQQKAALKLQDAYSQLGIKTQASLLETARKAREAYRQIANDVTASYQDVERAREALLDAEEAAGLRTKSIWRDQIGPAVVDVIQHMRDAMTGAFAQMLLGAKSFSEGWKSIWESIKASALNILNSVLSYFINTFLTGLVNSILGKKSAIHGAMDAVIGSGLNGPMAEWGATAAGQFTGNFWTFFQGAGWAALGIWAGVQLFKWFKHGFGSAPRDSFDPERPSGGGPDPHNPNNPYVDNDGNPYDPGDPNANVPDPNDPQGTTGPDWSHLQQLNTGTRGMFPDWGTGTPVMLHGREAVVPYTERNDWSSGGMGTQQTVMIVDGRVLGEIVSPAIADAIQRVGVARV